eukprot:TRINITY_DN550_c0_g1_i6.p1 TRINITY_DN550_c0_g1~~TRINITY_DN550_c0_g1_i6.p1  ORF type:complete len:158 (-),score=59.14 TRINITY_DN550_c0_g1_i6:180-653(-)
MCIRDRYQRRVRGAHNQAMSSSTVTVRPRKLITNRLLSRRQMIIDIIHPNLPTPDKALLRKLICEHLSKAKHASADPDATSIFGLRTDYGGGKSTGFALVYDSKEDAQKIEPKHRLVKIGLAEASTRGARKQRKEKKNREKKFRGTKKEKRVRPGKD